MEKGYWIICTESYSVDGVEIPRARMKYHTGRPIVHNSHRWRRATQDEIDTMQYHKGNVFNLLYV